MTKRWPKALTGTTYGNASRTLLAFSINGYGIERDPRGVHDDGAVEPDKEDTRPFNSFLKRLSEFLSSDPFPADYRDQRCAPETGTRLA